VKNRIIGLLITGYFLLTAAIGIAYGIYWYQYERPPAQPIDFEHQVHINAVGLECTHCHTHADKALMPAIPALSVCMECHSEVKTESPDIKTLTHHWESREPLLWNKVYYLPDHVYFSHKRHIRGNFECQECHGAVERADTMRQVRSLTMGWCVSCHNKHDAPVDCWICHK